MSVVIKYSWSQYLGYRNMAGGLPQHWDPLQSQAEVERVLQNLTELICAGPQDPRDDAIRACSSVPAQSLQLSLNLPVRDRQEVLRDGEGGAVLSGVEGRHI